MFPWLTCHTSAAGSDSPATVIRIAMALLVMTPAAYQKLNHEIRIVPDPRRGVSCDKERNSAALRGRMISIHFDISCHLCMPRYYLPAGRSFFIAQRAWRLGILVNQHSWECVGLFIAWSVEALGVYQWRRVVKPQHETKFPF